MPASEKPDRLAHATAFIAVMIVLGLAVWQAHDPDVYMSALKTADIDLKWSERQRPTSPPNPKPENATVYEVPVSRYGHKIELAEPGKEPRVQPIGWVSPDALKPITTGLPKNIEWAAEWLCPFTDNVQNAIEDMLDFGSDNSVRVYRVPHCRGMTLPSNIGDVRGYTNGPPL